MDVGIKISTTVDADIGEVGDVETRLDVESGSAQTSGAQCEVVRHAVVEKSTAVPSSKTHLNSVCRRQPYRYRADIDRADVDQADINRDF